MRTSTIVMAHLLAVTVSVGAWRVAQAEAVYRCVAKEGGVTFQDRPCVGAIAERRIDIHAKDPPQAERAAVKRDEPAKPVRASRPGRRLRAAEPASYECRTDTGMVFYRHARCPSTLAVPSNIGRNGTRVTVHSQSMPRSEACRRMRNQARDGDELDERPSTYDRNLGRDICRDY